MRRCGIGIGFVLLGAVVLSLPAGAEEAASAGELVKRLFAIEDGIDARIERFAVQGELQREYHAVREEVIRVLRASSEEPRKKIACDSAENHAMLLARAWRIVEARELLLDRIDVRLDPTTIPSGGLLNAGALFPAAFALTSLPVEPEKLAYRMRGGAWRTGAYVLVATMGKRSAIALLEEFRKNEGYGTRNLERALDRIRSTEFEGHLLPRPGEENQLGSLVPWWD